MTSSQLQTATNANINRNSKRANKMKFTMKKYLAAPLVAALLSLSAGAAVAADTFYDVTVQTGWHKHASTDASIYVTLYGTRGKSPRYHLNIHHYNDNERGQKTTYTFRSPRDLGRITKIVAYNSNDNKDGPGWQLSNIRVGKVGYRPTYFPCNKWLATHQKTTRILYANKYCR